MEIDYNLKIVKLAGNVLKDYFGKSLTVSSKGKKGLLTKADLKSEKLIISKILEKYPDHSIISEESKPIRGESDFTWMIDPLDGTTNFAMGIPYFAVSIALLYKNKTILGIVYNPITDELFFAEHGKGAFLNNRKISVSKNRDIKKSVFILNKSYESFPELFQKTSRLARNTLTVRIFGATSLDLCQVAAGRVDGLINLEAEAWDFAGGLLIAREAGALSETLLGKEIIENKKQSLLVSGPNIFKSAKSFL